MLRIVLAAVYFLLANACLAQTQLFSGAQTPNSPVVSCDFATGIATGIGGGTCVSTLPTCDGVANTETSFNQFRVWAQGWQATHSGLILLSLPAANCKLDTFTVTFSGVKKLLISGYGTTLSGNYFHLGGDGQFQNGLHSTRIQDANINDTTVTFNPSSASQPPACNSNATCASLFTVGGWGLVAGIDTQTGLGFPSNPAFFQYVNITAIDSTTGTVTFTPSLTDAYKSTWPYYNKGNSVATPDDGGPATLYAFPSGWDVEVEWRGVTFTATHPLDGTGKSVTFTDCTFTFGGQGVYITQARSGTFNNVAMSGNTMEPDKMVESLTITNSAVNQINFQSIGGAKLFTFSGSTVNNMNGTPLRTVVSNSSSISSFIIGASLYGFTKSVSVSNSNIGFFGTSPSHVPSGFTFKGKTNTTGINETGNSMSGGIITIPNSNIMASGTLSGTASNAWYGWMVPGANLCWADVTLSCTQLFQVTDVTQDPVVSALVTITNASPAIIGLTAHGRSAGDIVSFAAFNTTPSNVCTLPNGMTCNILYYVLATGLDADHFQISTSLGGAAVNTTTAGIAPFTMVSGNTYVHTSLAGGFPSGWTYTNLWIRVHPSLAVTFNGVTGDPDAVMLNEAAAQGLPMSSYSKNTYLTADTASILNYPIWGNLQKMNVIVNTAYVGAGTITTKPNPLFGTWMDSTSVLQTYSPATVSLKVVGTRSLDATGGYPATWTGGQAGDTLNTLPASRWANTQWKNVTTDISSSGIPMSVTVEVITNQGVVVPLQRAANDNRSVTRRRRRRAA